MYGRIKNPIMNVINEMMYHAADEIKFPHSQENVEYIMDEIEHNYDITINETTKITAELMGYVIEAIDDWKEETRGITL